MSELSTDARLQQLLDKDAIVDLVHRYSYLVDHKRYDELALLFTEDCITDYGPGLGGERVGRAAFRAMFGAGDRFVATSHHNANVLVRFDSADRATLRTSLYAWHQTADGNTPQVWGCYHDVAVRTTGGWRLTARRLRVAGSEAMPVEWAPLIDPDDSF